MTALTGKAHSCSTCVLERQKSNKTRAITSTQDNSNNEVYREIFSELSPKEPLGNSNKTYQSHKCYRFLSINIFKELNHYEAINNKITTISLK